MTDILQTGRWWEDTWWEGGKLQISQPAEEVRRAVAQLREYFTADRVLRMLTTDPGHPLLRWLCYERGTRTAHFLISTASYFSLLSSAKGFPQKLVDLTGDKYYAARLELETAAVIANAGLSVEFPPEGSGSKSPDIFCRDGDGAVVAVECKRLEEERWESLASELMMRMIRSFPESHDGQSIVVQAALDDRLSEILMGPSYDDLNEAIIEEVCARVRQAISGALTSQSPPINLDVPGIGRAAILPKAEDKYGEVSGMHVSRIAKLRRTLQNGLFRAIDQLPAGVPGIAVIHTDVAPHPALARAVFDAITRKRKAAYCALLGMIIVGRVDMTDARMMLVNAYSDFAGGQEYRALSALREAFRLAEF